MRNATPRPPLFLALALVLASAAVAARDIEYVVTRFKLVDADLDFLETSPNKPREDIGENFPRHRVLKDGDTIGGAPNRFSIVAEISPYSPLDKNVAAKYRRPTTSLPAVTFTQPFVHTERIPPYSLGKDVVVDQFDPYNRPGATDYWPVDIGPGLVTVTAHVDGRADLANTIRLNVLPAPKTSVVGGVCKIRLLLRISKIDDFNVPMSVGIVAKNGTLVLCLGELSNAEDLVVTVSGDNAGRRLVAYEGATDCTGEKASDAVPENAGLPPTDPDIITCYNLDSNSQYSSVGSVRNTMIFYSRKSLAAQAASKQAATPERVNASKPLSGLTRPRLFCFKDCLDSSFCGPNVPCLPVFSPYDSVIQYYCGNSAQRKERGCLQPFEPSSIFDPLSKEQLEIGGFFLVNAYTNQIVRILSDGDTIGAEPYDYNIVAEPQHLGNSVTFTAPFRRTDTSSPFSLGGDLDFLDYLPLKLKSGPVNITAYVDEWAEAAKTISLNVVPHSTTVAQVAAGALEESGTCAFDQSLKLSRDSEAVLSVGIAARNGTIMECFGSLPFVPLYFEQPVRAQYVGHDLIVFEGSNYCAGVPVSQESEHVMSGPFKIACDTYSSAAVLNAFVALSQADLRSLEELGPASIFGKDGFIVGKNPVNAAVPVCELDCVRSSLSPQSIRCEEGVPCVSVKSPYSARTAQVCGSDEMRAMSGCFQTFLPNAAVCEQCGVVVRGGKPFIQDCVDGVGCGEHRSRVCGSAKQLRTAGCLELAMSPEFQLGYFNL